MPRRIQKPLSDDFVLSSQLVHEVRRNTRQVLGLARRTTQLEATVATFGLNGEAAAIKRIAAMAPAVEKLASRADILDKIAEERNDRDIADKVERQEKERLAEEEAESAAKTAKNPFVRLWHLIGAHTITGVAGAAAGAIAAHFLPHGH